MKLYINNFHFNDELFIFNETITKHYIYSKNCILIKKKDKYYKETLSNYDCFNYTYNDYEFYFDNNEYNYNELYNYIPLEHISVDEQYFEMFIDYNIKLIKHCYFNEISYYFEINDNSDEILNKILSFLLKK